MQHFLPPQDLEIEQSILSGCILYENLRSIACDLIDSQAFYKSAHQKIFACLWQASLQKKEIDLPILANQLKAREWLEEIGGATYLSKMVEMPIPANMENSCKILLNYSQLRSMIATASNMINICSTKHAQADELIDQFQREILNLTSNQDDFITMEKLTIQSLDRYEEAYQGRDERGIKTGFYEYDSLTGGLKGSKLIAIAARPRIGKTAFMLNWSKNIARKGHKVGIFSLEMDKEDLDDRLMSSETGISTVKFHTGHGFTQDDWISITGVASEKSEWPIIIDDQGGVGMPEIRRRARKMKKMGCEIIFIDQLSKIYGDNRKSLFENTTRIVNELSELKKELRIPIILLCQIHRVKENKIPNLENLKQTGAIEEDADQVIILHRDYEYSRDEEKRTDADFILAKNRLGPSRSMKLEWYAKTTEFENPSQI